MGNSTKKTIIRGMVVALSLSVGVATTANAEVVRLSGKDRYSTSDAIVKAGWEKGCETAILTSGLDANTVDVLTVAPLAKDKNAPVVLVNPKDSVAAIVAKFTALNTKTVYIANGTSVISTDVDAGLKGAGITNVIRLGGATRYETALNIAKTLGAASGIVIASGNNAHLVDSLSIAAIAAAKKMPIFLASSSLDAATTTYINSLAAKTTYVLGGTAAISNDAVKALPGVNRLAGAGRYETNAKVVNTFKTDSALNLNNIFIASGENANLVDSSAGAPLAASIGAPIIFIHNTINPDIDTLLKSIINGTTKITELGGVNAITAVAHDAVNKIQIDRIHESKDIVSVVKPHSIALNTGADMDGDILNTKVVVTLADNTTTDATVTFDAGTPRYDSSKPGIYVFTGTLNLLNGISNSKNLKVLQTIYVCEQVSQTSELYTQSLDGAISGARGTAYNNSPEYLETLPDKGASFEDVMNEMGIALVLQNTATTKAQLFSEVTILREKIHAYYKQTGSVRSTLDYTSLNKITSKAITMLDGVTPTAIGLQADGGKSANALIEEINNAQMLNTRAEVIQGEIDAEALVLLQKMSAYSK